MNITTILLIIGLVLGLIGLLTAMRPYQLGRIAAPIFLGAVVGLVLIVALVPHEALGNAIIWFGMAVRSW